MEGGHLLNWQSINSRKEALHRTKIERSFLAAKDFDTNLVHFLRLYVIISNVHVYSFTGTISHVHRRVPKTVFRAQYLVSKKLWYISDWYLIWRLSIFQFSQSKENEKNQCFAKICKLITLVLGNSQFFLARIWADRRTIGVGKTTDSVDKPKW